MPLLNIFIQRQMIHNIGKFLFNKRIVNHNLIKNNSFQYFIYLKDHNKKINPQKSKVSLSYMNPKILGEEAPQQKKFVFLLRKKNQRELQRKLFEQYKQKVLKGQIDEDQVVPPDALWGEQEKPKHYYQTLSKVELMKTSNPQVNDVEDYLTELYKDYFSSNLKGDLPQIGSLLGLQPQQLVEVALLARQHNNLDRNYWYQIETAFGNKFYKLSSQSLIKLHFALNGRVRMGTTKIGSITTDLLSEDMSILSKKQLINLFYSCRFLRRQNTPFVRSIAKSLEKFYPTMTIQQKINWLLTYNVGRRPALLVQSQKKIRHQQLHRAHEVLFNLQFPTNLSQHLTHDLCIKLIYSLAKLRAENTNYITDQILAYIRKNFQSFCSKVQNVYKALFYLEQVNGGVGVYDVQIFQKFVEVITKTQNFQQLNKYEKIKTLYAIWNYRLMDDNIFQLYKNVEIEADSTILHYFCQIQLSRSSEREWQVLRCTAQLQSIPLPYFVTYKRFYNYMRETTDWDLTPIYQKLRNTQYIFNALRYEDQFYRYKFYANIMKFLQFTQTISPFQHTFPIDNLELVQFGSIPHQVSIDVIDQTGFIPGTDKLKLIFVNKVIGLKQIGWKHIYIREKQIQKLPIEEQFQQLIYAHTPYIEEQLTQIQRRGQIRAQEIQYIRQTDYWDNLVSQQAQGLRNNPQEYLKKVADQLQRQKKLMEDIDKLG